MADTSIFEVARATHEEIERYEQAIVDLLMSSSSTASTSSLGHKEQLKRDHKVSELLDRMVNRKQFLNDLYDDTNGDRAIELELISSAGPSASGKQDSLGEFYKRLNKIKDYHKKYPQTAPEAFVVDFSALEASSGLPGEDGQNATSVVAAGMGGLDFVDRMFSGEENAGRFMDLYVQHEMLMNLKGVRRLPYAVFLDEFDNLHGEASRVPQDARKTDAYRKYLSSLKGYLSTFMRKTKPLEDIDAVEAQALASFEEDWASGKVPGWGKDATESRTSAAAQPEGQGIWCEACKRFYSKQTVYDAHLTSPKHQKAADRLAAGASDAQQNASNNGRSHDDKAKATAQLELLVQAYGKVLDQVRKETRANVERKAALTERERQMEAEQVEAQANDPEAAAAAARADAEDDGEGDERIYNPLKLPLGWDGKPIPYWLYKLHGLGVEYKCEICSDYVYQGRKNFEKHFSESRHAFGMRALGLPNTKHFHEITKIADALALADKLKKQGRALAEEQGDAEEVEDEHGNTYSRKTYEMMKRQGLL